MADIRQKAAATAYEYQQGNIAVLDDDTTRRLVASVALTESRGGASELTSRQGFVGTYQFGAQALANADFVDSTKLAAAMSGFKSEWAWANSGGMSQFLENRDNWKHGLSLEQFKQSPELQNEAFKRTAERAYDRAAAEGVLKEGDKPEKIAGFLKVEHIMGYGHAKAAANGERVFRAPDGTSNYDYMHDLTRNRDGLSKFLAEQRDLAQPALAQHALGQHALGQHAPALTLERGVGADMLLSNPNHTEYERYRQSYDLLKATNAFDSEAKLSNAAGHVTARSIELGMQVHSVLENKRGELFPTQDPGQAHEKTFKLDRGLAEAVPLVESSRQVDDWSRKNDPARDNPQQIRTLNV
jgi:hypothetical protein